MSGKDLVTNLIADTVGWDAGIEHARGGLHDFHHEAMHVANEIAATFAAGFSIDRGFEAVKGQIEQITELSHLASRTGIDVNDLMALQLEAKKTGTDFETLQGAVRKLGVNIAENLGGGEKEHYFKDLGLDVQSLMDMNPAQQFTTVGDAIAKVENITARGHLAFELLGRSGAETLNMLTAGAAGLEDAKRQMGIISEGDVERIMKEAHEAMIDLDVAGQKLSRTFAADLAPAMTGVTKGLEWLIHAGRQDFEGAKAFGAWAADKLGMGDASSLLKNWAYDNNGGINNLADWEKHHKKAQQEANRGPSPEELDADEAANKSAESQQAAELNRQMQEAQKIREQADPYEKYHREVGELMDNQLLSAGELGDALSRAAKEFNDEMDRRDPIKKLVDEADKLFEGAQSNADRFKENIQHISDLFDQIGYSQDAKEAVLANEAQKFRDAEGVGHLDETHHQHGPAFAGAYDFNSREGYSQILRATQPNVDDQARKQTDLQTKLLEVNNVEIRVVSGDVRECTVRNAATGELIGSRLFRDDGTEDVVT